MPIMRKSLFCLFMLAGFSLQAQYMTPDKGEIFRDDVIPRIDITLPADSLAEILNPQNRLSDYHYHARFVFDNGSIRDTVEDIGFRLRGNTSRSSQKKSFKVSFNTYEKGRKYYGLEKMNLNGEHNDPTISRSKLCWELCRQAGIPASRANHVELYINGNYFGLYIHVEHIDEQFVKRRFGNNHGNLYKCLWPADLTYKGADPNLYKESNGSRRTYELRTNVAADDYSDLAHFIDILNNTPTNDLACELEKVFDVNSYLKAMAMDILTANWDGPIFNKNNFYLYHNPLTDRFIYIPYDLDNTYGIDWFRIDWGNRDIYQWASDNEPRPIYERILQVPMYRDRFSYFIHSFVTELVDPAGFFPYIDSIKTQITPSAAQDNYRTRDYGFSLMDFQQAFDQPLSQNHLPYGIKDYLTARRGSILQQVQAADMTPVIFVHEQRYLAGGMRWELEVVDEKALKEVKVSYQLDGNPSISMDFRDDGMQGDRLAGDGIWTAETNWSSSADELSFYFTAEDSSGHRGREPFCGENILNLSSALVINELMADNDTVLADNFGEFEDYIELYNSGSQPIFLGDLYITDDLSKPDKDRLPAVTLAPGAYLLLWADGDSPQGANHLNFRLSKSGEQIGIFTAPAAGSVPLDTLSFGAQAQDVSYGRIPNGSGPFVTLAFPSPGANNEWMTQIEDTAFASRIYPNPFVEIVKFEFAERNQPVKLEVFDIRGRKLMQQWVQETSFTWHAKDLPSGMYLALISQEGQPLKHVKLLKR